MRLRAVIGVERAVAENVSYMSFWSSIRPRQDHYKDSQFETGETRVETDPDSEIELEDGRSSFKSKLGGCKG